MATRPYDDLLSELDTIMEQYDLNKGDTRMPVSLRELLANTVQFRWFWHMPEQLYAISVLYGGNSGLTVNDILLEPDRSPDLRHAETHDLAHILRGHEGAYRMWRRDWASREYNFGRYLRNPAEKECEITCAYLLVRKESLLEMDGYEDEYIAAVLDVPTHLVKLRAWILKNYKK